MTDRITAGLMRLYEDQGHRIVFWYDASRDLREAFDAVDLPGVTKLEIANNEFGLKYRMLRREPKARFLLYKDGPEPPMVENWLLDVQLASAVFRADQAAIWVADLGIPAKHEAAVRDHAEFYRSGKRLEALRAIERERPSQSANDVRRKMLAVCAGVDGDLDTVIEALLAELADGHDDVLKLVDRVGLAEFFWKEVTARYGYAADAPDFQDFAITLFSSAWARAMGEAAPLNTDAALMFRRWSASRRWGEAFEKLSGDYKDVLKIRDNLASRDFRTLIPHDHFEEVDRRIVVAIVEGLARQSLSATDVLKWVRDRRQSHWFSRYADVYQAIGYATEFQQALAEADLTMISLSDGVKRYSTSWFRLDQLYRKFIYHMQKSGQSGLLSALYEAVENRYTTNFVLKLNDAWQDQVARLTDWVVPGFPRQMDFYREQAAEFRRKDQKVVVIISDALRYEVAEEALREIRKLNRFDAELKPMIGVLPSYTQLGMAALLPHRQLAIRDDNDLVLLDGESTMGAAAREKALAAGRAGDRVKVLAAKDFMNLGSSEGRDLFRDHDVLYLYHNQIDAIGDKLATEENVPAAAETAIEDLVKLVRKLTSANFSNILITADHGFLWQHRALEESGFALGEPEGEVVTRNRRFVIGRGLGSTGGMKKFTAAELGLGGDQDILIPNSINRLRVKGSGSRFVHGGASLQEIVLPVLRVGKQRKEDVGQVSVQIIPPARAQITTGQIQMTFYQAEPVTDKQQPRQVHAAIFAGDGTLISDEVELDFDFVSENPRERELSRGFLLSKSADAYNNQTVFLKLRTRIGKTSHFDDHASQPLLLKRGISTDFDF
ncbi:BREX-1 system phosphatase PglZ type A [Novosphingobium album (ex Hu et al. 2023)]|uniref:BREX-1 system phosphatase PglZ type A n=1 Tax=Novosphingobium album (ex Hu et al. 2023) TaxID=2930093 RepID=A0ABT0B5F2_9SPHN|nr:BREX-1 system phosphatase PglZ type A [Novosphingobium album (ex Hu et al. 2023)]MCJ2180129.1 BREX-1 system phosphatase PglZ type A [Novosphingobium album (ex Hu et al. 2023)]